MGARNRVGIGLSYRLARLHSLSELVPWNRFLGACSVLARSAAKTYKYSTNVNVPPSVALYVATVGALLVIKGTF
jgi:hypothetical protein